MQTEEPLQIPEGTIWYIEDFRILQCKYLCLHPTMREDGENYHILLNPDSPFVVNERDLRAIIHDGFKSYLSAQLALAIKHEEKAIKLRKRVQEITENEK